MPNIFVLDVRSSGVCARIGINKAPLAVDQTGKGQQIVREVGDWIMPRDNKLTVFLYWPPGTPYSAGKASVNASVYLSDPKSPEPKPIGTLASFSWPLPVGPETYPFVLEVPLVAADPPPTRLWTEAPRIEELTDADKTEILARIEELRQVLLPPTDKERAYALTRYKFDESARASGGSTERMQRVATMQYGIFKSITRPLSKPLEPRNAVFELVADRKVVSVTNGEKEAIAIHDEDSEQTFAIDVFLSKVNGRWIISR
jgi:hypothetical protein